MSDGIHRPKGRSVFADIGSKVGAAERIAAALRVAFKDVADMLVTFAQEPCDLCALDAGGVERPDPVGDGGERPDDFRHSVRGQGYGYLLYVR